MATVDRTHRRLLVVVGLVLAVTIAGMVALWPRAADLPETEPFAGDDETVTGVVRGTETFEGEPDPFMDTDGTMLAVTVELLEGPDQGRILELDVDPTGYPEFNDGDRLVITPRVGADGETEYYISDFQRLPALTWLLGLFILAVLVIGRWHGLRSLLGLALSLLIVVRFIIPSILSGQNPPLVALVGALAIMIVTLYLTHGVNEMTTSAVVGTAAALTLTVGIALVFIAQASISGFSSDDAVYARFAVGGELDLRGLVLAGLIIAALGVLDDVTVSQSSTVFALHDTDRTLTWASLFARAMRVGRDHIASVVNTLFLAYAGASLALLVLFSLGGGGVLEIVNSEIFAEEVVKIIVGSLGLIAAVPFTTALAAAVAVRRHPDAPPLGGGQPHGHGTGGARSVADVAPAIAAAPPPTSEPSPYPHPGDHPVSERAGSDEHVRQDDPAALRTDTASGAPPEPPPRRRRSRGSERGEGGRRRTPDPEETGGSPAPRRRRRVGGPPPPPNVRAGSAPEPPRSDEPREEPDEDELAHRAWMRYLEQRHTREDPDGPGSSEGP